MKSSSTLKIAKKYAEALSLIKLDQGLVTELDSLSECFKSGSELSKVLNNPGLKIEQRLKLVNNIFADKLQTETLLLLKLLIKRRRLAIVEYLGQAYKDAYNKAKGITEAKISSASGLSNAELDLIKSQLERIFKQAIEVTSIEDANLIAGQRINVAGKVIDSSIQSKLKQLKQLLK